jgi:acyl-CoA reductase-like NAD-dependent aldehyde dehydrogenase
LGGAFAHRRRRIGMAPRADDVAGAVARARAAFLRWRLEPPRRGEVVRRFGPAAAPAQAAAGAAGEHRERQDRGRGLGEVQEMIDMCDFAVGCRASSTGSPSPASGRATG